MEMISLRQALTAYCQAGEREKKNGNDIAWTGATESLADDRITGNINDAEKKAIEDSRDTKAGGSRTGEYSCPLPFMRAIAVLCSCDPSNRNLTLLPTYGEHLSNPAKDQPLPTRTLLGGAPMVIEDGGVKRLHLLPQRRVRAVDGEGPKRGVGGGRTPCGGHGCRRTGQAATEIEFPFASLGCTAM